MAAMVNATTNEDGIIEPTIEGTRMDPAEYAQRKRQAQIKVAPTAIKALEELGSLMDEAVVKLHALPIPACDICGSDGHWTAEGWVPGYTITICNDCKQRDEDNYRVFTRLPQ